LGFRFIIVWKRLLKRYGKPGKLREFHFAKFVSTLTVVGKLLFTCVMPAGEPTLLFANRHDVRQLHLYTGRYQLIYGGMHSAIAVDYDIAANAVFWTDITSKNISRSAFIEFTISATFLALLF